jgi:hypothetical protein
VDSAADAQRYRPKFLIEVAVKLRYENGAPHGFAVIACAGKSCLRYLKPFFRQKAVFNERLQNFRFFSRRTCCGILSSFAQKLNSVARMLKNNNLSIVFAPVFPVNYVIKTSHGFSPFELVKNSRG